MKVNAVDPIEKQTLILRLSVNIYRMTDIQIERLLAVMEQTSDVDESQRQKSHVIEGHQGEPFERQMMIARLFVLIQQMDSEALLERLQVFNDKDFRWSRDYPRMECNLLVDFAVQGRAYRGYLRDISAGGIFIVTAEHFEVEQEVLVCFAVGEANGTLPLKISGKIKRQFTDGIGIQYHQINHQLQNMIHSQVEKKIRP